MSTQYFALSAKSAQIPPTLLPGLRPLTFDSAASIRNPKSEID